MATRKVIRGDSDSFTITFLQKSNNCNDRQPIDITGWDIFFTVRNDVPATSVHDDENAIIHKMATIVDGPNGKAYFEITGEDTDINPGEYWYDIQYVRTLASGEIKIKSVPRSKYVVLGDITRFE